MVKAITSICLVVLIASFVLYAFNIHIDVQDFMTAMETVNTSPLNIADFTLIPDGLWDDQDWGVFNPVKRALKVLSDGVNTVAYLGANVWRTCLFIVALIDAIASGNTPAPTPPSDGGGGGDGWRGGR